MSIDPLDLAIRRYATSVAGTRGRFLADPPFSRSEVIARHAPLVHLHPDETHFPSSVDWYLERVGLRRERRDGAEPVLEPGEITAENLIAQVREEVSSGGGYLSDYYLDIPDGAAGHPVDGGDLDGAECYAHLRPTPPGAEPGFDIQYLFFYPYNGNISSFGNFSHQGDWEHITVRVSEDGERALRIYYGAHNAEGEWYGDEDDDGFDVDEGTHPVVYAALTSHASYPRPGRILRRITSFDGLLPDDVVGPGRPWRTWHRVIDVGASVAPSTHSGWLRFSGRWGRPGHLAGSLASGPPGPAFQDWWFDDDGSWARGTITFGSRRGGGTSIGRITDDPGQIVVPRTHASFRRSRIGSLRLDSVRAGTKIRLFGRSGRPSELLSEIRIKRRTPNRLLVDPFARGDDWRYQITPHVRRRRALEDVGRIEIA